MEKKTVNISDNFIKSLMLGILGGVIIVFIVHFFGRWTAQPPADVTPSYDGSISYSAASFTPSFSLSCPLDEYHTFKGRGATYEDIIMGHFSQAKFGAIVSATFDGHWKNILIIGLISALVIYFLRGVNFKIVKE